MAERLPEGTYVELVGTLFDTLLPTAIMAVSFIGVGAIVYARTPDPLLGGLLVGGAIAALGRVSVLLAYRGAARQDGVSVAAAHRFERRFALPYLSFAILLGLFGARVFTIGDPAVRTLIVGLLFGYGAGVAAGLSLRPRISVPSILVAIVPTVAVAALTPDLPSRALAALFAIFLAGGIESMRKRYRMTAKRITMRRLLGTLARFDELTGLPNRLALRERFETAVAAAPPGAMAAVHYLDLDKFKPVNDRYGHATGDLLLKAVAARINGLLRPGDFAARLGGDEFLIVQTGVAHADEAELFARRVSRALGQRFAVDGHEVTIGASVGYALSPDYGRDLDRLMQFADEALYRVKRSGGGAAAYSPSAPVEDARLSA